MAVPSSKELSLKEMTAGIFEELKERKGWSLEKQPEAGLSLCGQPFILRALGDFEVLDETANVLIFALFEGQTGCGMEKGLVSSKRRSWETTRRPPQKSRGGGNGGKWGHQRCGSPKHQALATHRM